MSGLNSYSRKRGRPGFHLNDLSTSKHFTKRHVMSTHGQFSQYATNHSIYHWWRPFHAAWDRKHPSAPISKQICGSLIFVSPHRHGDIDIPFRRSHLPLCANLYVRDAPRVSKDDADFGGPSSTYTEILPRTWASRRRKESIIHSTSELTTSSRSTYGRGIGSSMPKTGPESCSVARQPCLAVAGGVARNAAVCHGYMLDLRAGWLLGNCYVSVVSEI